MEMKNMKRVIEVKEEDMDWVVEKGVKRRELNEYLRDKGMLLKIDKGEKEKIGGMD